MRSDFALADLGFVVAGITLVLFFGQFRPFLAGDHLRALHLEILGHLEDGIGVGAFVVARHDPAEIVPGPRFQFDARHAAGVRVPDAGHPVDLAPVIEVAMGDIVNAEVVLAPGHVGHDAEFLDELNVGERRVQNLDMKRIESVLPVLQPIAFDVFEAGIGTRGEGRPDGHQFEALGDVFQIAPPGERGTPFGRAHIGEDHPVALFRFVPRLADLFADALAVVLFARHVDAVALDVELPAVVAAADAVILDPSVIESRSAVTAAVVQDAGAAVSVTKHDQILAENLDLDGHVGDLPRHGDGLPVAPHEFAHRGPGTRFDESPVVGGWLPAIAGSRRKGPVLMGVHICLLLSCCLGETPRIGPEGCAARCCRLPWHPLPDEPAHGFGSPWRG